MTNLLCGQSSKMVTAGYSQFQFYMNIDML